MSSTVSSDWHELFNKHKSSDIEPSTYKSLDKLTIIPELSFLRGLIWAEIRRWVQNDPSDMSVMTHEDLEGPGEIYIGGMHHALNDALLEKHSVSAVLTIHPPDMLAWDETDVSYGLRRYGRDGCRVQHHLMIPLEDNSNSNLIHYFEDTYDFIHQHSGSGRNILIHCKSGRSRSVAVLIAYLQRKYFEAIVRPQQIPVDEARETMRVYRESVTESLRQQRLPVIIIMERFQSLLPLYDLQLIGHPDYGVEKQTLFPEPELKKQTVLPQDAERKVHKKGGAAVLKIAMAIVFYVNQQRPLRSVVERFFEINEAYFFELEGINYKGRVNLGSKQAHPGIMKFFAEYANEYNVSMDPAVFDIIGKE